VAGIVAIGVVVAACADDPSDATTTTAATSTAPTTSAAGGGSTTTADGGPTTGTGGPSSSAPSGSELPDEIRAIMDQPRYADATWSLLVKDVDSGQAFYAQNADRMSFTGSTRKLFSVGNALRALGADHRIATPVYRLGDVGADGTLTGSLALVGAGDLVFGGRRIDADTVEITTFDHNDANGLGTAILSPQDPLYALDELASQVKAAGISAVNGDVVIDDRLFEPYRVPNGNLLISPVMLNENQVDVTVTPGTAGQPATVTHRPETAAFTVDGTVTTGAAGSDATVALSDRGLIDCLGTAGCHGTVSGDIPVGYAAPLSGEPTFVGTFRVEDPDVFMRTAFIEALARHGVTVTAPAVGPNPTALLPSGTYDALPRVAVHQSAPYSETARLILKVSLNLGANVALSLFGVTQGARTVDDALAAERKALIGVGIDGDQFDFPTNGSGTPDSEASPQALVDWLVDMHDGPDAELFKNALPILGVDGSLATSGTDLPAKGHVFAKTGTSILPGDTADSLVIKAQNFAGYIETKSGRTVAYALMVNDAGPADIDDLEGSLTPVITDEAKISNIIYESL
jgi:D-alanyl-D-alanine carboxypeptidase/D-alanyl-D-alanine-endopeptidase (penicillin-binding protein 4)